MQKSAPVYMNKKSKRKTQKTLRTDITKPRTSNESSRLTRSSRTTRSNLRSCSTRKALAAFHGPRSPEPSS
eukprot:3360442-Amphidinium_carterae.1